MVGLVGICQLISGNAAESTTEKAAPLTLQAAITTTLARNSNVRISQTQVDFARAAVVSQRGAFDWRAQAGVSHDKTNTPLNRSAINAYQLNGYDFTNNITRVDSTNYSLQKQLESGIVLSTGVTQLMSGTNLTTDDNLPVSGTGSVVFKLNLPILKGGLGAAALPLRSSELQAEAARFDQEANVAQAIYLSSVRYWSYLSGLQRLRITQISEQRGEQLLQEMERLVQANEVPRAELDLIRASLNDRRYSRIGAEQSVLTLRMALGRALGLSAPETDRIGLPAESFPHASPRVDAMLRKGLMDLTDQTTTRRQEFIALLRRSEANRADLNYARNAALPQLDLSLSSTHNSLAELSRRPGFPYPGIFNHVAAPGHAIGVTLSYPLENNAAKGYIAQQLALQQQIDIQREELTAAAKSNVEQAAAAYTSSLVAIAQLESSRRAYEISLDNEKLKKGLGMSTLIDVLNVEDRLIGASLGLIQAQLDHALAIAQVLYESGHIFNVSNGDYAANLDSLLGR